MSTRARVLVIDDILGWEWDAKNTTRYNFCRKWRLQDVTEGNYTGDISGPPIAEVVFHPGQKLTAGQVKNDIQGTLEFIRQGWQNCTEDNPRWSLLLLDLHFNTGAVDANGQFLYPETNPVSNNADYFGFDLYDAISADPMLQDLPVLILSAIERDKPIDKRLPASVAGFLPKTAKMGEFKNHLNRHGLFESPPLVLDQEDEKPLIGHSVPFLKCLREIRRKCEQGDNNILLLGAGGAGKELLAKYAHLCSPKKNGPFVSAFLQGLPDDLIGSELFGHEKGAFTGATQIKVGKAEHADKGTLFIDEFGDMSNKTRGKMLRLLEKSTRETSRVGSPEIHKLDIQVVMATNKIELLFNEEYKRQLESRINIIEIPSLEERREDIELLATTFIEEFEDKHGAEKRTLTADALQALLDYPWSQRGNIRKLRELLESAVADNETHRFLHKSHLNLENIQAHEQSQVVSQSSTQPQKTPISTQPATASNLDRQLAQLAEFNFASLPFSELCQLEGKLSDITDAYIKLVISYLEAALQKEGGKITPAMKFVYGKEYGKKLKSTDAKRRFRDLLGLGESLKLTLPSVTPLDRNSLVFETIREYPPKLEANRLTPKGKRTTWDLFLEQRGFSLPEIEELRQAQQTNKK